ncbi:serine hydroxymethyltransferase [Striga asiatica]|uniref:Serine hydroxymethyltransferase n=1 Tax=Striga asiatica TaxID=4170 RepID=A0A5A7P1Z0_STRAF|nr:serine hydroxymethyltransferase [Striga asiatica]
MSSFEYCDNVTSTIHKSLWDPRGGIIFDKRIYETPVTTFRTLSLRTRIYSNRAEMIRTRDVPAAAGPTSRRMIARAAGSHASFALRRPSRPNRGCLGPRCRTVTLVATQQRPQISQVSRRKMCRIVTRLELGREAQKLGLRSLSNDFP